MANLSSLLNTARDALAAQSYGLTVTGQNITNANTPGYVRREAILQTQTLGTQTTGSVAVLGLRRVTNDFTERQVYQTNGNAAAATAQDQTLASLEGLFNDASGMGLGSSLDQLFSSFSALSANPNDTTTRQGVLDAAGAFAQRANDTASSIKQTSEDLRQQAQGTIDAINQRAKDIAKLDLQIAQAESQGQDAADLKDQRNQKLLGMSSLIDVHTFTDGQGNLVVQAAGTTLIDGSRAGQLSLGSASDGKLQIFTADPGGALADVTKYLTGGQLAGIRDARDVDLFDVSKQLDQFVFDVATAVNAQHAAGTGADGGTGRNLFDVGALPTDAAASVKVSVDVLGRPDRVAAALSSTSLPGGSDNAAALSALSTTFFASGGSKTAAQAYADMVGHVGQLRADSKRDVETQTAVFQQAQAMQDSLSGVSLDEEMIALTKFQNAYQAASKVLSTVDQLLGTLMNSVGR